MPPSSFAPTYKVPQTDIVSVEHPCIIKNVEKGIAMLGGSSAIKQVLEPDSNRTLGLSFHPTNADSRTVVSFNNQTSNVLLRITVPKRIGKRKRGSNEAFQPLDSSDSRSDAKYLVQSLHDNPDKCQIVPLGTIGRSHIWRSMPDFAYTTKGSDFLSRVKSHIIPRDLQSIKDFDMHRTYGDRGTEAVPPPVFSTLALPYQYSYRQSQYAKEIIDRNTGQRALKLPDTAANTKVFMQSVREVDATYPTTPDDGLPSLASQHKAVRALQPILNELFNQRPIWTRRALINHLPDGIHFDKLRFSLGYVAFAIRGGPWRDTLCKLGVDPRTSPECRKYQTVMFQIPRGENESGSERPRYWGRSTDKTSHIFTGELPQSQEGSIWQLCDIQDPQLKALVDVEESQLPSTCENRFFGWYHNGTISKIRSTMKVKLDALFRGERLEDSVFQRCLDSLPDRLEQVPADEAQSGEPNPGYLAAPLTVLEMKMAAQYRTFCRQGVSKEASKAKSSDEASVPDAVEGFMEENNDEDAAFDTPSPGDPSRSHEDANEHNDGLSQGDEASGTLRGEAIADETAPVSASSPRRTAFEDAWEASSTKKGIQATGLEPTGAKSPPFEGAWQESTTGTSEGTSQDVEMTEPS